MQKDPKFSALVAYFEQLAREHVKIQHSNQKKHFFRFELDEVLTGKAARMNYPAFILEGYRFDFIDRMSDNPVKVRHGAFILAQHISDPGDYEYIHAVWDELEEIADDILVRMKADKRNPASPIRHFDIDTVEGTIIATELGGLYGIRITYSVNCAFSFDVDKTKWIT